MTEADCELVPHSNLICWFIALIIVNVVVSLGTLTPTHPQISAEYPTPLTPAGFTFAIWGPIFLLQGGGVLLMVLAGGIEHVSSALAPWWTAAWLAEMLFQIVFCQIPMPSGAVPSNVTTTIAKLSSTVSPTAHPTTTEHPMEHGHPTSRASRAHALFLSSSAPTSVLDLRLVVFGLSLLCLFASFWCMLTGARRMRKALVLGDGVEYPMLVQLLLVVPTGLNAAWSAIACGVNLVLVLQSVAAVVPVEAGGVKWHEWLVHSHGTIACAVYLGIILFFNFAAGVVLGHDCQTLGMGLAFAATSAWACLGIWKGDDPPEEVKLVAFNGEYLALAGALVVVYWAAILPKCKEALARGASRGKGSALPLLAAAPE